MIVPGQEPVYLNSTITTFSTGVKSLNYNEIQLLYMELFLTNR